MIPCRMFLQKCEILPHQLSHTKLKIILTLNSIYYDEIQPFKTKYFCLTSQDVIGVQVATQDNDLVLGTSTISLPFKLALQSQTVQLVFKMPPHLNQKFTQISLFFLLQPVTQFSKKKLGLSTNNVNIQNSQINRKNKTKQENIHNFPNLHHDDSMNNLQISFSNRDPLVQTSRNFPRELFGATGKLSTGEVLINRENTMFKDSYEIAHEEGSQSLESLALQREKILGELFGKLKRDKRE